MIDLYTWTTPNGRKPIILLEELGLPYNLKPINIGAGDQKKPDYLAINPNGKIPALVDDGIQIFESGAILVHLAEKTGKLLPKAGQARSDVLGWLFFQVGGIGPMFGQAGHFASRKETDAYAHERYKGEAERLTKVLDGRLGESEFLGSEYSIADVANYPWVVALPYLGLSSDAFPNVKRWLDAVGARDAVKKAMAIEMPK